MKIEEIKLEEIAIELRKSFCRVKDCSRIKKEVSRVFFNKREQKDSIAFLKEKLNLKEGMNKVIKEDILNLIKENIPKI